MCSGRPGKLVLAIALVSTCLPRISIAQTFEQRLVNKFCPSLVLDQRDLAHGTTRVIPVCPEPVEIVTDDKWREIDLLPGYFFGSQQVYNNVTDPIMQFLTRDWHDTGSEELHTTCGDLGPTYYAFRSHMDFGGPGPGCDQSGESSGFNDQPPGWGRVYADGNSYTRSGMEFKHTVYAHIYPAPVPEPNRYIIQYWFFYPYNDGIGDHEGDWEHIDVHVTNGPFQYSDAELERVVYYFHESYVTTGLNQLQAAEQNSELFDYYVVDETHPVVFVGGWGQKVVAGSSGSGPGSHGSFPIYGNWDKVVRVIEEDTEVYSANENVGGNGLYIPYFAIVDNDDADIDGVILIKNPDEYDFSEETGSPHFSWLAADTWWGHPRVNSFSPASISQGNEAPNGPAQQETWERSGYNVGRFKAYGGQRQYDHASDVQWSPPAPLALTWPPNGETVSHIVDIRGTIHYADSVVVDFGSGTTPTTWSRRGASATTQSEVYSSTVGNWNTGVAPSGTYTIRVKTYHGNQSFEQTRTVSVTHKNLVVAPSGGNFTSIYAALNSAQTEMGDTLNVSAGIYQNSPTLDTNKIVYVRAIGGDVEIEPNQNSKIISLTEPMAHLTFDGITFRRIQDSTTEESYGAWVSNSWVTFKNCSFIGLQAYRGYAVRAVGSSRVDAENCLFYGNRQWGFPNHARSSVVCLEGSGAEKPTGSFINCLFRSNEGQAVEIIYDSSNPLQGLEPKPHFDGCIFEDNRVADNVVQISNSLRTINVSNCIFVDNEVSARYGFPQAAIYCDNAKVWLDNCTIARNIQYDPNGYGQTWDISAVGINSGAMQPVTIDDCIIAFNAGPVVNRSHAQMPTDITLARSIVYGNTAGLAGGYRSDAQWAATVTSVFAENPAFCDAANGNYHLYAFSPAALGENGELGLHHDVFTETVGAYDVGCVPSAEVSVITGSLPDRPGGVIIGCPQGDNGHAAAPIDHLTLEVNFENNVITRSLAGTELSIQPPYISSGIVSSIKIRGTSEGNLGNGWLMTLDHPHISGYGTHQIPLYLNGYALEVEAVFTQRSPDFKSAGAPGPAPCGGDIPCPDGKVTNADLSWFFTHYPTASNPNAQYHAGADIFKPFGAPIGLPDFSNFSTHFVSGGHKYPSTDQPLQTVGEPEQTASTHVDLDFTEEYVTATSRKLYVDVTLEDCADKNWCLFAMRTNRSDLTLASWEPTQWAAGSAPFSALDSEDDQDLVFGVIMINDTAESTRHLGRLVFDVEGSEPMSISNDEFVLTVGEVELADGQEGANYVVGSQPVFAHMSGVSGRVLNQTVQQVFHNRLEQNFPNPFNPQTTLAYSLKAASDVSLTIYDVAGRRVRELVNEHRNPGAYKAVWNGQNDHGSSVASGVYFYKLVAGSFVDTKKMIMLK